MIMKYLLLPLLSIICAITYSQTLNKNSELPDYPSLLPYNRMIQPAGTQIVFGKKTLENHALDAAISPDGKWLAVEERYSIVFISTIDNKVRFILENTKSNVIGSGMNTYSGIIWHNNNGKNEILWSSSGRNKRSFVVSAIWDGTKAEFGRILTYKAENKADFALPNEILINNESGKEYLYVVLNGNNKVIKQDFITGDTIWVTDPGVAPYGITLASQKIYVTNWAGRHPDTDDKEVAGVPWGLARVDNGKAGGATREGSVTVINPTDGKIVKEIIVGLHPNEIISDKSGKFVYVTNSNSDNVSVIRTSDNSIAETISLRLQPSVNSFFGDSPNGLTLSADEKTLFVANGLDNAIAVIKLGKQSSGKGSGSTSLVSGFIPTGVYPSSIAILNSKWMYVCNLEGTGKHVPDTDKNTQNTVYNSHELMASVSVIKMPGKKALRAYTDTVIAVNDLQRATLSLTKPRENTPPVPVPERAGEPSVFKHVVYIIKENRTYDQILGDMKKGDGDPGLCIYGNEITPNTHKLADEFILLDNFMVSGKCSAEGHQWTDASIVTDYIEKNMRAWFRSYAHVQNDALVYAPTGFIWDNAMSHGRTARIYGEASEPVFKNKTTWSDVYNKYKNGEKVEFTNSTTIEPVRKILSPTYPSYGNHEFTDAMRADELIKELKQFESLEGDKLPELMVVALPNDHTAGIKPGYPTPRAMVADNDFALGRIVEAFSTSKFWNNTVIFIVEDDSQGGWDHVSPYRTVSLVISPYSRLKNVNHTFYTQPSLVRTIEQILGLPPMNIQDAIANPMRDCFGSVPDMTPYKAVNLNIPIDEITPALSQLSGKSLYFAKKSMLPEFSKVDSGNDDLLNRILWFAAKGNIPYPSKFAGAEKSEEEDDD
jgi:YVTN family beta-propeller protein